MKKERKIGYKINRKKTGPNPNHYLYKGDSACYISLHGWVRRHKGPPVICEHCGTTQGKFQWANKSHEYIRELTDWISLCIPCHRKHDLDEDGNKRRDTIKFKGLLKPRKGKLSEAQIIEIYKSELGPSELASKYNVRQNYISRIQSGSLAVRITKKLSHINRKPANQLLTTEKATEIFNSSLSQKELAIQFGVSVMTISDIKTGRTWGSATGKVYEGCKQKILQEVNE